MSAPSDRVRIERIVGRTLTAYEMTNRGTEFAVADCNYTRENVSALQRAFNNAYAQERHEKGLVVTVSAMTAEKPEDDRFVLFFTNELP